MTFTTNLRTMLREGKASTRPKSKPAGRRPSCPTRPRKAPSTPWKAPMSRHGSQGV